MSGIVGDLYLLLSVLAVCVTFSFCFVVGSNNRIRRTQLDNAHQQSLGWLKEMNLQAAQQKAERQMELGHQETMAQIEAKSSRLAIEGPAKFESDAADRAFNQRLREAEVQQQHELAMATLTHKQRLREKEGPAALNDELRVFVEGLEKKVSDITECVKYVDERSRRYATRYAKYPY